MASRTELHEKLCELLGSRCVYYQPPETIKMVYPCIVYERNDIDILHADNQGYTYNVSYRITYIDKNPDSEMVNKIASLPSCRFNRHYTFENLNHDVFVIYY